MGMAELRAHRQAEAEAGFPLLRGCPSTSVQRWLARVEGMGSAERVALAEHLSDLTEREAEAPMALAERAAFVAARPQLARAMPPGGEAEPRLARTMPVKTMALLLKEQGGFDGVARLFGLDAAQAEPPRPHLERWEEAVPAKPAALRKAAVEALVARFAGVARADGELTRIVAEVPEGRLVIDLLFAASGRPGARQMEHGFFLDRRGGGRALAGSYDGTWLLPGHWDLITEGNLAASVAHLVRVTEVRLALVAVA